MRTIAVNIYKFDELSKEGQESAITKLGDINVDHGWWEIDGLLDLTKDEMDEVGIELSEIEGVLFSYTIREFDLERHRYIQFENVIVNNDEAFRKFLKIPTPLWDQCAYYFTNDSRDCNTCLELQTDELPTDEEDNILNDAIEIMAEKIHGAWKALSVDYEYLTSEEAIKDTIQANEYEFYEDGTLI